MSDNLLERPKTRIIITCKMCCQKENAKMNESVENAEIDLFVINKYEERIRISKSKEIHRKKRTVLSETIQQLPNEN